jgi:hypothetical protein
MMSTLINAISFVVALQGVAAEQLISRNQPFFHQAQDCSAIVSGGKQRLACFDSTRTVRVKRVK